jgi:hypothetical protein
VLRLKRNAPQLKDFLRDDLIAIDFRGKPESINLTPTQFFIKWLAKSQNRSEEAIRQNLYKKTSRSYSR